MADLELLYFPQHLVSKDTPEEGIRNLLKMLRPDWEWKEVQVKILQGGYINSMIHVFLHSLLPTQGLVFRIYGYTGELFGNEIDREKEIIGLQLAAKAGCGAPVHCVFKNGVVLGYTGGRNITLEDFVNPEINCLIAKAIAQIHVMDPSNFTTPSGKPSPFDINKDLEIRRQKFTDAIENQPETMSDPEDDRRTFSHNDVHGRNMIYDSDTKHVYLVDFEMVSYGEECQDLSCVFAMADYWPIFFGPIAQSVMEKIHNEDFKEAFVRSYLEAKAELQGGTVTQEDVSAMKLQVDITAIMFNFSVMLFGPLMLIAGNGIDGITAAVKGKERYFSQKRELTQKAEEYKYLTEKRKT